MEFEEKFGRMFPPSWEVSERICVEFCEITRSVCGSCFVKFFLLVVMCNRAYDNVCKGTGTDFVI